MPDQNHFSEIMQGQAHTWMTIEDVVALCDDSPDFWGEEWLGSAVAIAKKTVVRKYMRTLRDESNMPLWHSLVTIDSEGGEVREYKQEAFFDKEDYRQVIQYYVDRTLYTMRMAETLRDRAAKRYTNAEQLALPWE